MSKLDFSGRLALTLQQAVHTQVDCITLCGRFCRILSIVELLFEVAWYYGVRRSFLLPSAAHALLQELVFARLW